MKKSIYSLVAVLSIVLLFSCSEDNTKKSDVKKSIVADSIVVKEGKKIAMASFKVLKGELMSAINQGGPIAGVDICSSKAMTITDSLSAVYKVQIKRTSAKNRNPKNSPNDLEKEVLENWEKDIAQSTRIVPKVFHSDNGEVNFVAPIKMQTLCLTCHGEKEFINPDLNTMILEKYPDDMAHGYKEGQLRGAWSITFPKGYFDSNL